MRTHEKGSAVIEMALVFIPLMFSIFSLFELTRAMWTYHTLASSVKKAVRVAIVHGARCAEASNDCPVTIGGLIQTIQQSGVGIDISLLQLTFTSTSDTVTCNPASTCSTNDTQWPPSSGNAVGQSITINGKYGFNSVLKALWPGQATGTINLAAKSTEVIQF